MDETLVAVINEKVNVLEKDVEELKKDRKIITRVEAKQDYMIKTIEELKESMKLLSTTPCSTQQSENKTWSPIVIELIKLLGIAITIIGAIVGVVKVTGN